MYCWSPICHRGVSSQGTFCDHRHQVDVYTKLLLSIILVNVGVNSFATNSAFLRWRRALRMTSVSHFVSEATSCRISVSTCNNMAEKILVFRKTDTDFRLESRHSTSEAMESAFSVFYHRASSNLDNVRFSSQRRVTRLRDGRIEYISPTKSVVGPTISCGRKRVFEAERAWQGHRQSL